VFFKVLQWLSPDFVRILMVYVTRRLIVLFLQTSLLWTIPSGYYSAAVILPIHHRTALDMIAQPVRTCLHISSIQKPTSFLSELLRRTTCLLFAPPRVMVFIIFSVIFLIYLALSPISLPCGTFRVSPSSRFTHFCVVRPFCSFWRAFVGNVQDSICGWESTGLVKLCGRTACVSVLGSSPLSIPVPIFDILHISNVLFWRTVSMYIYLLICTMT
jgi:hypothetical protein